MASTFYDYIVIGSGLSGLSIATALSKSQFKVALLESNETYGGYNRAVDLLSRPITNGIRHLPDSEASRSAIEFLSQLLELPIEVETKELTPYFYENNDKRPFVGFGEKSPPYYEELSYFLSQQTLTTSFGLSEWIPALFKKFSGDFFPRSYVTKMVPQANHIGGISHLIVNGHKTLEGRFYIYTGALSQLPLLLPEDALGVRLRQKLSKGKYWMGVCLDLLHKGVENEALGICLLPGLSQEEFGPFVGKFEDKKLSFQDNTQYSQWLSFVSNEHSEDEEFLAGIIKKMKKQIKKAFPSSLEDILFERILLVPEFSGFGELKLNADFSIPSYSNVVIGTGQVHQEKNIVGSLLQAKAVLKPKQKSLDLHGIKQGDFFEAHNSSI